MLLLTCLLIGVGSATVTPPAWNITSGTDVCHLVNGDSCITDGVGSYANHEQCTFQVINGPAIIERVEFDIEFNGACSWDSLTVHSNMNQTVVTSVGSNNTNNIYSVDITTYCGNPNIHSGSSNLFPQVYHATGNELFEFKTDYVVTKQGFTLCIGNGTTWVTPTTKPTRFPWTASHGNSTSPTPYPSQTPSVYPTHNPTLQPTLDPSRMPSYEGDTSPPTSGPIWFPTFMPSNTPTSNPSMSPTVDPSRAPSYGPTHYPTQSPNTIPVGSSSSAPSPIPTDFPSGNPTESPNADWWGDGVASGGGWWTEGGCAHPSNYCGEGTEWNNDEQVCKATSGTPCSDYDPANYNGLDFLCQGYDVQELLAYNPSRANNQCVDEFSCVVACCCEKIWVPAPCLDDNNLKGCTSDMPLGDMCEADASLPDGRTDYWNIDNCPGSYDIFEVMCTA